jgi:CHAT domain-containing protein/tetratricopeptide (TPR) repeat protein
MLQQQGKLAEAASEIDGLIPALRSAGNSGELARALGARGDIALSMGRYEAAQQYTQQALALNIRQDDLKSQAGNLNILGAAEIYIGRYAEAADHFSSARAVHHKLHNPEGEAGALDNLGNAYFFQGRYLDAFQAYQDAARVVADSPSGDWIPRRRQITATNLATLYQRLGQERRALEIYGNLRQSDQAMLPDERAQLLVNEGALYRRLGDPVKALDAYAQAQALFSGSHHADGEIGALRNIGIAKGLDLGDLHGALDAFSQAERLARAAGDTRGLVQAELYSSEVMRRLHRLNEARSLSESARDGARTAGLIEEEWKALYVLGRIAEEEHKPDDAVKLYQQAIEKIEGTRARLAAPSLRTDFLADKRDVYDSVVSLRLTRPGVSPDEIFHMLEESRSRGLQDRLSSNAPDSLGGIQALLPGDTLLMEFWSAGDQAAVVWATSRAAGVRAIRGGNQIDETINSLLESAAKNDGTDWREPASRLGAELLTNAPIDDTALTRLIIVPDGRIQFVPFELLQKSESSPLLIDRFSVSYLPSARLLSRPPLGSGHMPRFPWQQEAEIFADPTGPRNPNQMNLPANLMEGANKWQALPDSQHEARSIASVLPGRAVLRIGENARKEFLADGAIPSLVHFATHAVVDSENPELSLVVLAPKRGETEPDYLFFREIPGLDLRNVDLVTLSACETERGAIIRGDGAQSLGRAFLAAGTHATVSTLWRVSDDATAQFMTRFYGHLSDGEGKADALRHTKLEFLHSGTKFAAPRYWAAFVLNGESRSPIPRFVSWKQVLAVLLAGSVVTFVLVRFARPARHKAPAIPRPA